MEEMKIPMNISADSSWLSDLEMVDEYILSDKDCNLNSNSNLLDAEEEQEFLSHDIASVFAFEEQRETLQQCLNTECISTTLSETFTDETSFESFDNFDFNFEKPKKQMKTMDHSDNDNITEIFSPKDSTLPSFYQLPQILSFDKPNQTEFYGYDKNQNETMNSASLGNKKFSVQNSKGSSKASRARRSPARIKDHIMAERMRREKLSQSFISLAALIPNLKKMDKATILAETIKYVKELKKRLEILEEKIKKPKQEAGNDDHYSSSNESSETECAAHGTTATESLFKVEARISGQHMLIRIHCQKHNGLLVKIITEIQSFELFVVNNSVLSFGDSNLDITIIAEIGEDYNLTIKELVNNLRMVALKFMSL